MKALILFCAWLAAVSAAVSCTGTGGEPARSPISPFGAEAAVSGAEPTGGGDEPTVGGDDPAGGGDSLLDLCTRACANIATCESNDPGCPAECASEVPFGCEPEYRAFVQCIATAPICVNGSIDPTPCITSILAVDACMNGSTGSGGAGGGSTGTAGASGAPAR